MLPQLTDGGLEASLIFRRASTCRAALRAYCEPQLALADAGADMASAVTPTLRA